MATLPLITTSEQSWTNINLASGILSGTKMLLCNRGGTGLRYQFAPAGAAPDPNDKKGFPIASGGEDVVQDADDCWVIGKGPVQPAELA